jgi:hypothetical protein
LPLQSQILTSVLTAEFRPMRRGEICMRISAQNKFATN